MRVGIHLCVLRLIFATQQKSFDYQHIDVGCHETAIRVLRRHYDWLAAHVEACIDNDRASGFLIELFDQFVVSTVPNGIDGLEPRGIIPMGDRRDLGPRKFEFIDSE